MRPARRQGMRHPFCALIACVTSEHLRDNLFPWSKFIVKRGVRRVKFH